MITAASPKPSHGTTDRPQPLEESDLRQLCIFVSRGCTIKEAARCIGCKLSAIRHEHETNDWFRRKLARAKMKRDLAPLRTLRRAMLKDWRAAAWFLERTQPEKFARRNHRAFTQKQANALIKDVTSIIGEESVSKGKFDRTSSRVEAAIRYACRAHNDMNRTAAELGRAMKHHDMKSPRYSPTLAQSPFTPSLASGASPNLPPTKPTSLTTPTKPQPPTQPNTNKPAIPIREVFDYEGPPRVFDFSMPESPLSSTGARGTAPEKPPGRTDCRPNGIDNRSGPARPIVSVAQPQEATRAGLAPLPPPQRGGSK